MATPYTYPENVTGLLGLLHYANAAVNGMFGLGILIAVGFVTFLVSKQYSSERAFGFTSFMVFLIALLFRFMQLINDIVFFACIVFLVAGLIYLWIEREKEV